MCKIRLSSQDIRDFLSEFSQENYNDLIYNEFSLQFELGFFLRKRGFKVYFELNIKNVVASNKNIDPSEFVKKEMDLFVINSDGSKSAIELKFPTHNAYKKRMRDSEKDITFMEQVNKIDGFDKTYCLMLVHNNDIGRKYREKINNVRWEQAGDAFLFYIKEIG